jgi:SAM-dependent methyltransferase
VHDPAPWDAGYRQATQPWDIGRPQAPFAGLEYAGRAVDVGCGTGEHTLLAAEHGATALGIDFAEAAIELARAKAAARGVDARFEVLDAFELPSLGERFDLALDSGLYHTWPEVSERQRYAAGVASVLEPGGMIYLMCFSERTAGDWGPQRIREAELRETFSDGWELERLERSHFELNPGMPVERADAWLVVARRC